MSPEYHELCRRLASLCRNLLPQINSVGVYTDVEYDRTRAFVALVHAEIEAFIETRCLHVVTETRVRWLATRAPNRILFALYAMSSSGWSAIEEEIENLPKLTNQYDLIARVSSSFTQYQHVVSANNGIREVNLKKMLIPLSIWLTDLNPAWILEMSNFGGFRGQVVHTTWKANQPPDPGTMNTLIRVILLPGLNRLDRELSNVLAALGPVGPRKTARDRVVSAFRILATGHP
jgi:hypothetical protein